MGLLERMEQKKAEEGGDNSATNEAESSLATARDAINKPNTDDDVDPYEGVKRRIHLRVIETLNKQNIFLFISPFSDQRLPIFQTDL